MDDSSMETENSDKILTYMKALQKAKTDNERFAALMMISKIIPDGQCDIEKKRQILDAVGGKFFSRLLKTENVPEGCSPDAFKLVALSILSALCTEPEISQSSAFTDNIPSFNKILQENLREQGSSQQLIDDVYACFNSLIQSTQGIQCLIEGHSVPALCEAVISNTYGREKAQDILYFVLSSVGTQAWTGCETMFNTVFSHFSKLFKDDKGEKKFEICKTLVFLLTSVPREVMIEKVHDVVKSDARLTVNQIATIIGISAENEDKPPWVEDVVTGLDSILRSKIGTSQREPALRLASMLVQVCGIESMLPPVTEDCKLFLLTTHLCCVEVRMVLEASDIKQAFSSGRLLSSCYSYLECIINHLTAGPTLKLDERQILQLHSAMMGAFGAVTHFLKRVSDYANIQWNSIVLATIRILAAWMAEETTALKDEVYELLPFLIQVSKLCLPASNEFNSLEDCDTNDTDKNVCEENSELETDNVKPAGMVDCDANNHEGMKDCDTSMANNSEGMEDCETVIHKKEDNSEVVKSNSDDISEINEAQEIMDSSTNLVNGNEMITKDLEDLQLNEKQTHENISNASNNREKSAHNHDNTLTKQDNECDREQKHSNKHKHVTFDSMNHIANEKDENLKSDSEKQTLKINSNNNNDPKSECDNRKSKYQRDYEQVYDVKVLQNIPTDDKEILTEKELQDLHLRVNIFHFLLPGMCHMTADDEPRQILLNCGALSLLDLYMWRQWEKFLKMPENREVQSSLVILCNIFLNLTIVEPDAITKYEEFSHILLLTIKGISVVELNYVVLWSHLITLGLMLIRLLHKKTEEFLESESISTFFHSCVKYVNGAYTVRHKKKGQAVMELAESFTPVWDQISQTWFLSMQAFSACIPLLKEASTVALQSGWLPSVLKNLLEVRGNGVAEEIRSCYLLLFVTIAKESETAKMVIKEKKGIEISKMYKFKELQDILQTSPKVKSLPQT